MHGRTPDGLNRDRLRGGEGLDDDDRAAVVTKESRLAIGGSKGFLMDSAVCGDEAAVRWAAGLILAALMLPSFLSMASQRKIFGRSSRAKEHV